MPLTTALRARWLARVAATALVFLFASLSAGGSQARSSSPKRAGRLTAMATASVGPHAVAALIAVRPYRVTLRIAPNLARVRNHVSLTVVDAHGRPVRSTRVTVRFAMPAMKMQDVYDGQLARVGAGTYGATEPILGMPGTWQLHFVIAAGKRPPVTMAVTDRMSAH